MTGLTADRIPVAVTLGHLPVESAAHGGTGVEALHQPNYQWLAGPVTPSEVVDAYRANALFDAHQDDPEFGHRLLADEARDAGEAMADRTAWQIASAHGWWSVFGKKRGSNGKKLLRSTTTSAPSRTGTGGSGVSSPPSAQTSSG